MYRDKCTGSNVLSIGFKKSAPKIYCLFYYRYLIFDICFICPYYEVCKPMPGATSITIFNKQTWTVDVLYDIRKLFIRTPFCKNGLGLNTSFRRTADRTYHEYLGYCD
jgi:hypothetical protein